MPNYGSLLGCCGLHKETNSKNGFNVGGEMKKLLLTGIAALLPATGAPAANILLLDDINNPAIYLKIIGDLVKEDGDTFLGATDSHGFSDRSRGKPIYVVLESNGGLVVEGLKIGKAIYQRRYNTVVYNKCASTCALIWLAGANRWVAASGSVGFHAIYLAGTGEVSSAGNAMVGAYLLDIELSMTAIQYVNDRSPIEYGMADK